VRCRQSDRVKGEREREREGCRRAREERVCSFLLLLLIPVSSEHS